MTSEPYKLHVAIFPSLQVINAAQGSDMLITRIEGSFSRNLYSRFIEPHSKFVVTFLNKLYERAIISWRADKDKDGKPVTVKDMLKDLAKDGIIDVAINNITFTIPYVAHDNYTMKNQQFWKEWTFRPYTFRPKVWHRLKAEKFPCKELYHRWITTKREYKNTMKVDIFKRWKDVILFNEPHPELDNDDIRSFWLGRKFAIILKETRGKFDLMDLGELKK